MADERTILVQGQAPKAVVHERVDRPAVYVVAETKKVAWDWARDNKPDHLPKCFSVASEIGPRGLLLSDDTPVFVVGEMPEYIRDSWRMTGGRLVFV